MAQSNYEIREGYRVNTEIRTIDTDTQTYWTPKQIRMAAQYQWYVYAWARDLVKERGYSVVVDVGCGPAVKLDRLLTPCTPQVFGIDQPSMAAYCTSQYAKGTYLADDFENPSVELGVPVDLIICCDVIEHLLQPDALIEYLKRLAGPDTAILISTPDRDRLRGVDSMDCPNRAHIREWSGDEFVRYLEKAGFTIEERRHSPPVRVLPNMLFLRHFLRQMRAGKTWRYNHALLCRYGG